MGYNSAVHGILKRSITISVAKKVVNLLLRLDCKESVSRGQTTTLYNRISSFITYAVLKSYNQQIENNILTSTEGSNQKA